MSEIVAHFTNGNVPLTSPGTLPTIRIRRIDTQALVVTDSNMTEMGDGNYSFTFAEDPTLEYSARADGDPAAAGQVTPGERYVFGALSGITEAQLARLDADISSRATQADILSDATPFQGADIAAILTDTGTTIPGLIAALNDVAITDILSDSVAFQGADIAAILVDTGTTLPGLIVALNDLTALVPGLVWDEVLTGLAHNITNSAGKRLRQLNEATVATEANVVDVSPGVSSFDTDLTEVDGFWQDTVLIFVDGALTGQARTIAAYLNASGNVVFDEALTSAPANGDSFLLLATHVHPIVEITGGIWNADPDDYVAAKTFGKEVGELGAAIAGVSTSVWATGPSGNQGNNTFGEAMVRLDDEFTRTRLFTADAEITTAGRHVPAGAVSHMEVQRRNFAGSFPGEIYRVVFGYVVGDLATAAPTSSNTQTLEPTDGTFSTVGFPDPA